MREVSSGEVVSGVVAPARRPVVLDGDHGELETVGKTRSQTVCVLSRTKLLVHCLFCLSQVTRGLSTDEAQTRATCTRITRWVEASSDRSRPNGHSGRSEGRCIPQASAGRQTSSLNLRGGERCRRPGQCPRRVLSTKAWATVPQSTSPVTSQTRRGRLSSSLADAASPAALHVCTYAWLDDTRPTATLHQTTATASPWKAQNAGTPPCHASGTRKGRFPPPCARRASGRALLDGQWPVIEEALNIVSILATTTHRYHV